MRTCFAALRAAHAADPATARTSLVDEAAKAAIGCAQICGPRLRGERENAVGGAGIDLVGEQRAPSVRCAERGEARIIGRLDRARQEGSEAVHGPSPASKSFVTSTVMSTNSINEVGPMVADLHGSISISFQRQGNVVEALDTGNGDGLIQFAVMHRSTERPAGAPHAAGQRVQEGARGLLDCLLDLRRVGARFGHRRDREREPGVIGTGDVELGADQPISANWRTPRGAA